MTGRPQLPAEVRRLLVGVDGPEGRTSPAVAALVAPMARTWLTTWKGQARRAGAVAELESWVQSLEVLAAVYRESLRPTSDAVAGHLEVDVLALRDDRPVRGSITGRQAAERLGVSARSVGRLRQQGLLDGHQVGPVWVYDPAQVNELADRRSA